MISESKLQFKIQAWLRSKGFVVFKVMVSNRSGISDLIACEPLTGKFIAIEVKAPGKLKQVSALQEYFLNSILDNEGIAFAADSLETVISTLNKGKKDDINRSDP